MQENNAHHNTERTVYYHAERVETRRRTKQEGLRGIGPSSPEPEIKEALDARELVSSQIANRLDECFKLIGEKPVKINQRLHDVFIEDFRRELNEIEGPVARKLFVLAKASHLAHLQVASYMTLIAAADTLGHPGVGVLLESCLADKLAFMERTRRLIREHIAEKVSHA